jgi:hypothetical protein
MTDWLAERVQHAIDIAIEVAQNSGVELRDIFVFGFESYEEDVRKIVVGANVVGESHQIYDYWGVLAEQVHELNDQPPPRGAQNADVTIQVTVHW